MCHRWNVSNHLLSDYTIAILRAKLMSPTLNWLYPNLLNSLSPCLPVRNQYLTWLHRQNQQFVKSALVKLRSDGRLIPNLLHAKMYHLWRWLVYEAVGIAFWAKRFPLLQLQDVAGSHKVRKQPISETHNTETPRLLKMVSPGEVSKVVSSTSLK